MRAQISQHAHRITCWSPLWGAGPLSGALLGDGASWSAPLPCKTTPTCLGTVRHLYRRPCIWGSGGVRSRRRPGAAGQVETQAAGRSSCSAVSTRPVVPGDRGVHGWDSFLLPVRAGTNPCCNWGTSRLQTLFLSRFELGSKLLLVGVSRFWEAGRSCLCRRASRSVSRWRQLEEDLVRALARAARIRMLRVPLHC